MFNKNILKFYNFLLIIEETREKVGSIEIRRGNKQNEKFMFS